MFKLKSREISVDIRFLEKEVFCDDATVNLCTKIINVTFYY